MNTRDITVINNYSTKQVFPNYVSKFQQNIPDFRNFIGREKLIEDIITTDTDTIAILGLSGNDFSEKINNSGISVEPHI